MLLLLCRLLLCLLCLLMLLLLLLGHVLLLLLVMRLSCLLCLLLRMLLLHQLLLLLHVRRQVNTHPRIDCCNMVGSHSLHSWLSLPLTHWHPPLLSLYSLSHCLLLLEKQPLLLLLI